MSTVNQDRFLLKMQEFQSIAVDCSIYSQWLACLEEATKRISSDVIDVIIITKQSAIIQVIILLELVVIIE
jgi:hypothetical protein